MIAGVVLDMDGLLFDTEQLTLTCALQAAEQLGLPLTRQLYLRTVGCTRADAEALYRQAFGQDYDNRALEGCIHGILRQQLRQEGMPLKPGARALLSELTRRGLPTALATSSPWSAVEFYFGLPNLRQAFPKGPGFSAIVTGDDVEQGKPDPEVYRKACRLLGLPPQTCLALEDSRNGILAAAAAGLLPVMVPDLIEPDAELRALCHAVLPSLLQVPALLDSHAETS